MNLKLTNKKIVDGVINVDGQKYKIGLRGYLYRKDGDEWIRTENQKIEKLLN